MASARHDLVELRRNGVAEGRPSAQRHHARVRPRVRTPDLVAWDRLLEPDRGVEPAGEVYERRLLRPLSNETRLDHLARFGQRPYDHVQTLADTVRSAVEDAQPLPPLRRGGLERDSADIGAVGDVVDA